MLFALAMQNEMACLLPPSFPHDLTSKPRLSGEADVYAALQTGLDDTWAVFYDTSIKGSRRRIDFVAVDVRRGLLAIEVKGGMVHAARGWFRQQISRTGQRKKIDPFGQLKAAVRDLYAAAGIGETDLPSHLAIWLPAMSKSAFAWRLPCPHILTRELLDPGRLQLLQGQILTAETTADQRTALVRIVGALKGKRRP